jgi:hypothetical protein
MAGQDMGGGRRKERDEMMHILPLGQGCARRGGRRWGCDGLNFLLGGGAVAGGARRWVAGQNGAGRLL